MTKFGYHYVYETLDAVNYGVPQFRRRLLLLATRVKSIFPVLKLPARTHASPQEAMKLKLRSWANVRDAIGDLPSVKSGESDPTIPNHKAWNHTEKILRRIRQVPKDGGFRTDIKRELWLKCHSSDDDNIGFYDVYGRLRWNKPANTITSGCTNPSKGRFIHPEQDRGLSVREAARLQSFPDARLPIKGFRTDFVFHGTDTEAATQVGNTFPVKWALATSGTIRRLVTMKA